MNTTIGVYDSHELAVDAVLKLREFHYPVSKISIMGRMDEEVVVDNEVHLITKNPLRINGLGAGVALGTVVGILMGVGIFAIPGGFLYGAGALVGAIAGFDFGLIGGGIAAVLTTIGVKDINAEKYQEALLNGKFLVIVHGSEEDMIMAKAILYDDEEFEQAIAAPDKELQWM